MRSNNHIAELIKRIEEYSKDYQISFQFWGPGNNNVFIEKHTVELWDSGGFDTIEEVLKAALMHLDKINNKVQK